jgi:hypothetical protein
MKSNLILHNIAFEKDHNYTIIGRLYCNDFNTTNQCGIGSYIVINSTKQ